MLIVFLVLDSTSPEAVDTDFTKIKLKEDSTMSVKILSDQWDIHISCIGVLPNAILLVGDQFHKTLKAVDVKTKRVLSTIQLSAAAMQICPLPNNQVAVSVDNNIVIITWTDNQLGIERNITMEANCFGLAFFEENFVVGTITGKVLLTDTNGQILSYTTNDGNHMFKNPDSICVITTDVTLRVYVSDSFTNIITMLSKDLKVMQTFKYPWQYGPYDIVAVSKSQILVKGSRPDREWSCIQVFDTNTSEFTELGNTDMNTPRVTDFTHLAYCPCLGNVYSVYQADTYDQFIHIFTVHRKGQEDIAYT